MILPSGRMLELLGRDSKSIILLRSIVVLRRDGAGRPDRMRDTAAAVAHYPEMVPVHAAVQLAAATVLLHEGVEGRVLRASCYSIT